MEKHCTGQGPRTYEIPEFGRERNTVAPPTLWDGERAWDWCTFYRRHVGWGNVMTRRARLQRFDPFIGAIQAQPKGGRCTSTLKEGVYMPNAAVADPGL